jgi:hypothetical protein
MLVIRRQANLPLS